MSIHKSLNLGGGIASVRSVFTRRERIDKLMEKDKLEGDENPFGLPKVRTTFRTVTKRQLKAQASADREESIAAQEAADAAARAAEAAGEVAAD